MLTVPDIVEAASLQELSGLVGFEVTESFSLPFRAEKTAYRAYWSEMAEVEYSGGGCTATYRQSQGTGGRMCWPCGRTGHTPAPWPSHRGRRRASGGAFWSIDLSARQNSAARRCLSGVRDRQKIRRNRRKRLTEKPSSDILKKENTGVSRPPGRRGIKRTRGDCIYARTAKERKTWGDYSGV